MLSQTSLLRFWWIGRT